MGERAYSFDANLELADNASAYTVNGFAQFGGADAVLDLGGNQGVTPIQQARVEGACIIDVTAIKTSSGNETYRLKVMGCNTPGFLSNVVCLGSIELGKGTSLVPATQKDSTVGRYELFFCTEQASLKYEFVKLFNDLAGTTPSISYQAFVAVLPEP